MPVVEQFLLVQARPFKYEPQHARRERAFKNFEASAIYGCLSVPVHRMKVWHAVIGVEHADDDAEEARYFGHAGSGRPLPD